MRVLFYYRGIENLGIEYLMSYLKAKGHQVGLLFDSGLDDNLFLKLKFMKWFNQDRFLVERAKEFDPDIIAFSIPTNLYPFFNEVLRLFKRELSVPIIAGGPHVTALPEYVLRNENIDMVCIGEGEEAFAELLDKMEKGLDIYDTKNIWFKKDGRIIKTDLRDLIQDLDRLPFPDKASFYEYGCFHDNLEIVTGRGCPFRCTFCNIHFQRKLTKGKGNFVRRKSVPVVIEELKDSLNRYDIRYVSFHDDTFTADAAWVEEFAELYRKEVNLPFYCFAYPTTVTRQIMSQLKSANCMQTFMGMDSGDADIRRNLLKRPMSDECIMRSARIIKDSGITLQMSAIFGFPGEKPESMWKTLDLAEKANPDLVSGYIFYPFPNTELFEYSVKTGYLGDEEIDRIMRGEGGYHHDSILRHPHKNLAVTLSKLIPLHNKVPLFLRPIIKKFIRGRHMRLSQVIYLLSIPLAFPFLGMEGIKVTLRMAWRAGRMRIKPINLDN
ncbi:hypothetical protein AMJ44_07060 [candidate division WOR-1 bacterium DG_54_3]|uniref:Uncharacterized protein n=1 Tax=candidate division WOR-1 bacterium DG_54_3 TaxID=1703775 RepID=A0A0S7XZL7_UNCSA|nr:MAG: hypothetical protein AMJ44_07060 [candidate division WOR-1 bacterium DG_54_3]